MFWQAAPADGVASVDGFTGLGGQAADVHAIRWEAASAQARVLSRVGVNERSG